MPGRHPPEKCLQESRTGAERENLKGSLFRCKHVILLTVTLCTVSEKMHQLKVSKKSKST